MGKKLNYVDTDANLIGRLLQDAAEINKFQGSIAETSISQSIYSHVLAVGFCNDIDNIKKECNDALPVWSLALGEHNYSCEGMKVYNVMTAEEQDLFL